MARSMTSRVTVCYPREIAHATPLHYVFQDLHLHRYSSDAPKPSTAGAGE